MRRREPGQGPQSKHQGLVASNTLAALCNGGVNNLAPPKTAVGMIGEVFIQHEYQFFKSKILPHTMENQTAPDTSTFDGTPANAENPCACQRDYSRRGRLVLQVSMPLSDNQG